MVHQDHHEDATTTCSDHAVGGPGLDGKDRRDFSEPAQEDPVALAERLTTSADGSHLVTSTAHKSRLLRLSRADVRGKTHMNSPKRFSSTTGAKPPRI